MGTTSRNREHRIVNFCQTLKRNSMMSPSLKLAQMVAQQGETVQRIDADTSDIAK